jgi:hypothetical protein
MFLKQPRSSRLQPAAPLRQLQLQLRHRKPVASQRFYTVAGRLLLVENTNPSLAGLLERLFAGWQLTPLSSPDRSPDIRIEFFCGHSLPLIPPKLNRFEIAEGGHCHAENGDFYLTLGNSLVHLQNGDSIEVKLWFAEAPGPADPFLARATSFAVCAALRRFGIFELHSAGVTHPHSDKGVLIVGPSGSGKTTLTLELAKAGWSYLSDDELLLSLVDGKVEARGFRSFFAVNGAAGALKTCFEPDTVFTSQRAAKAVPGVLFFIRLSDEHETQLRKLTQAESMTRLIRACPWATYDVSIASANLQLLSKLTRQTSAFDLSAGRDLLEPGCASDLFSQYARA